MQTVPSLGKANTGCRFRAPDNFLKLSIKTICITDTKVFVLQEFVKSNMLSISDEAISNKAGYTATLVACGCSGAVMGKVTGIFGQEQ